MSENLTEYKIEKLHYGHAVLEFDCGDEEINSYFYERSYEDVEANNSRVYVFSTGEEIIGYYAISTKSVRFRTEGQQHELSYPVLLIGQLGVNLPFRGMGWGPLIMQNAYEKGIAIAEEVGCMGLIVETRNFELYEKFYEPLGFVQIRDDKGRYTFFRKFLPEVGIEY
jgi:GNAT superfamily N-acetyltransferase